MSKILVFTKMKSFDEELLARRAGEEVARSKISLKEIFASRSTSARSLKRVTFHWIIAHFISSFFHFCVSCVTKDRHQQQSHHNHHHHHHHHQHHRQRSSLSHLSHFSHCRHLWRALGVLLMASTFLSWRQMPHCDAVGYSYARFIGPVVGPEREILVRDAYNGGTRVDYVARPDYQFAYGVEDTQTRVLQNRKETRDGDAVKGVYSVVDPDGTLRVVKYTADNVNGFQAEVITNGVATIHGHNQDDGGGGGDIKGSNGGANWHVETGDKTHSNAANNDHNDDDDDNGEENKSEDGNKNKYQVHEHEYDENSEDYRDESDSESDGKSHNKSKQNENNDDDDDDGDDDEDGDDEYEQAKSEEANENDDEEDDEDY